LDIYPAEIEDCLMQHPNVNEAIAFGVSVNHYEEDICTWVKLKQTDLKTTPEELIQFCLNNKLLADYKTPKYIKIVEDFPTTNMGKYLRRVMQEAFKLELGI
jgi:fatty-acyl-CoA synthase